jgi:hypothetical protein
VALVWVTEAYGLKRTGKGILFEVGEPTKLEWYARGRPATRDEIMASIESGLPLLREIAAEEGREAVAELEKLIERGLTLVPETVPTLSGGDNRGEKAQ